MSGHNYFNKKTVRDVPLDGKTILLRADYNVPIDTSGNIADDYRIVSSLPTIKYLVEERGCNVVIISHLGRPKGIDPHLSLKLVSSRLQKLIKKPIKFIPACVGDKVSVATKNMAAGEIILLENLRFHEEEEANDEKFAHKLAKDSHARYFVQDGFGVVHRAHASTSAITQFLPSVGGLLLEREYQTIEGAMSHPKKPLTAVLGGAKIADKIELIDRFINIADQIVIGGAMASTFLQYKGFTVGKSLVEPDEKVIIDKIYQDVAKKVGLDNIDDFLVLPNDVAVAQKIDKKQPRKEVEAGNVHDEEIILDIGTKTMNRIEKYIGHEGTVIWNGPLGYAEILNFAYSSARLALHLAKNPKITSIIGGGDTADFVLDWDKQKGKSFSLVSTGGGASLELMSGKKLPGVEALLK
ncbi:MAG: phosphoglycerate kinase [Candidatus Saccharibacteria bacterium]|nr:phosphoglycerate kinase [Candidatus Saccharibacteria bacterium]